MKQCGKALGPRRRWRGAEQQTQAAPVLLWSAANSAALAQKLPYAPYYMYKTSPVLNALALRAFGGLQKPARVMLSHSSIK